MNSKKYHVTIVPRSATLHLDIRCYAPLDAFGDWDAMSAETRKEFEVNGSIPCEGDGTMAEHCRHCRFGEVEEWMD